MTDDVPPPAEAKSTIPSGLWEHWCEHPGCAAWGSFGFTRGKSHPIHWYCQEHRAEGKALIG